ncbi:unnamed protein product [Bemisia tabaci]|uniref:Ionotropic receptor n=1 Tax=Bemisia tabaci TaxID=7038 RepID=A0AAI8Y611_BEMTA|nr:unnamed protein product [Bemisia tabaci]
MFGRSLRTLHLSTFALSFFMTTAIFQPAIQIEPGRKSNSIAFKVCLNTVQLSGRPLMYIVDFHSSSAVQPLIQNLHDSSITTILIRHPEELTTLATQNREMNIIFYVNDPDEILSLILSSVPKPWQHEDGFQSDRLENSSISTNFEMKQKSKFNSKLPHYCILVDDLKDSKMVGCDEQMTLSTAELEGSELLSDQNFNFTRSLYMNPIWNSKNYLSFMIYQNNYTPFGPNGSKWWQNVKAGKVNCTISGKNEYRGEILSFKFIWRFFKGIRTIICYEDVCDRYNPFSESIISYSGAIDESYFDFAVTNMHRKVASICLSDAEGSEIYANRVSWQGNGLFLYVYEHFSNLTNFTRPTVKYNSFWGEDFFDKMVRDVRFREMGQLLNLDLHFVKVSVTDKSVSYPSFDYSVGVETRAICILTPHSKKIPQFLVPFRSFSPVVWFLIGAVFAIFVLMQHAFQRAQFKIFCGLYSETEIRIFENTSSLWSIYAYFVSGFPPRLILGNLLTGKILFFIFSFSALIITTAFLGVMTTLLTKTVQYPEIDSLKDLQDSDFLIQTANADDSAVFFDGLDEFVKLKAQLVSNLEHYTYYLSLELPEHYSLHLALNENNHTLLNLERPIEELFEKLKDNVQTITENDAFLVDVPGSFVSKNGIRTRVWLLPQQSEQHLVRECLMTHPVFYSFFKNSLLFDRFNQIAFRVLESGHVKKFIDASNHDDESCEIAPLPSEDADPRPYDLNDLQLGFIGLLRGYVANQKIVQSDERKFSISTSTSGEGDKILYPDFDNRALIGSRCDAVANGECTVPYAEDPK